MRPKEYRDTIASYDPAGNKLEVSTPTRATQYAYDGDNHAICTAVRMNPAAFPALPASACTLGTQGSFGPDRITQDNFDAAGELLSEVRGFGSPTPQTYATYTYGADGEKLSVADADGHLTQYAYDGFNRLGTTTFADASTELLSYDADGNILSRINRANETLTYTYDALDRMLSKATPQVAAIQADLVSWSYDLAGRVLSLGDTLGHALSNGYDTMGRVISATRAAPGLTGTQSVQYAYDLANNRTRIIWPDNYFVAYTYDAMNHMLAANENGSAPLATYSYDNLGRRAQLAYPNGATVSYSWSVEDDLNALAHAFPPSGGSACTSGINVCFTDSFSPAHQIVAASISNAAFQYAGTPSGGITAYAAVNSLNQYPSVTTPSGAIVPIAYDPNGNLTSDGSFAYAYDAENRLITASGNGMAAAYAYDPLGRRVASTVNGSATFFLHDGDTEIGDDTAAGTLLRRYIPGDAIDEPVAMVTPGQNGAPETQAFVHTDKMGSIIAMSGSTGALSEGPYTYDAYGNGAPATGIPFKFTGQRLDPETGLYYYRARYYSAALGRFLQTDPVGYKDDVDLYTYVGDDPTDKADPTGKLSEEQWTTIAEEAAERGAVEEAAGGGPENPIADVVVLGTVAFTIYEVANADAEKERSERTDKAKGVDRKTTSTTNPTKKRAGDFTKSVKRNAHDANKERNGGVERCEKCGAGVVSGKPSEKGVPTPDNQAQIDVAPNFYPVAS